MNTNISADKLAKLEEKYGIVWDVALDSPKAHSLKESGCRPCSEYVALPDGEYILIDCQLIDTGLFDRMKGMNVYEHMWHTSSTKAIVKDGYWDVESVMKATDELLKQTGYHGYFIENFAKANRGTYSFADRDLDLTGLDVLEVHIGS
tara:strand:- start:54 stop:497 length:444 start_codon:yes stop_codon:yes gene_type:complete